MAVRWFSTLNFDFGSGTKLTKPHQFVENRPDLTSFWPIFDLRERDWLPERATLNFQKTARDSDITWPRLFWPFWLIQFDLNSSKDQLTFYNLTWKSFYNCPIFIHFHFHYRTWIALELFTIKLMAMVVTFSKLLKPLRSGWNSSMTLEHRLFLVPALNLNLAHLLEIYSSYWILRACF